MFQLPSGRKATLRRRAIPGLAAIISFLPAVLAPLPASAAVTAVLTAASTDASNLAVGEVITGTLASGTTEVFSAGTGNSGIQCTASSFNATVEANPPAGGTASTSITSWDHSSCSTNLVGATGATVTSTSLPSGMFFNGSTKAVTFTALTKTIKLLTVLGVVTCVYRATSTTIISTFSNATGWVTITRVTYTKVSGPSICPSTLTYSSTFSIYAFRSRPVAIFLN